jgi:NADH-quinone oxidoreductase subunit K
MTNAVALAFVAAGSRWAQPDGQIMFIMVLTLAAAEASIGLALLLQLYRRFHTLDIDVASEMRG